MTALTSPGMSSTWVPQAEHAQALAELAAAREALYCAVQQRGSLTAALRLISKPGCKSFPGDQPPCRNFNRTQYAANAWCEACIAADALETLTVTGP